MAQNNSCALFCSDTKNESVTVIIERILSYNWKTDDLFSERFLTSQAMHEWVNKILTKANHVLQGIVLSSPFW